MPSLWYLNGMRRVLDRTIDLLNTSLSLALVTSAYTPNKNSHQFMSSISGELTVSGYSRQTIPTAGRSLNMNTTTGRVELILPSVNFSSLATGATIEAGVIFVPDGGGDSSSVLLIYSDTATNPPTNGSALTFSFPASGSDGAAYVAV